MKPTHMIIAITATAALSAWTGCESGSEPAAPEAVEPAPPGANPLDLPPKLSKLLRREMAELETGMHALHSALVRGDRERAAKTAQRIHDSFILKRELDQGELQTLVSQLPEDFVERDRAFHAMASELAGAAEKGELEQAAATYGRMTEACVGCHAAHAAERFPGLAP